MERKGKTMTEQRQREREQMEQREETNGENESKEQFCLRLLSAALIYIALKVKSPRSTV